MTATILSWLYFILIPSLLLGALWAALSAPSKKHLYFYLLGASAGLWLSILIPFPLVVAVGVESFVSMLLVLGVLVIVLPLHLSHKEISTHIPILPVLKNIGSKLKSAPPIFYLSTGLALGLSSYVTIPSGLQAPFATALIVILQLAYVLVLSTIVSVFLFAFRKLNERLLEAEQGQSTPSLFRVIAVSSLWVIVLWTLVGLQLYML